MRLSPELAVPLLLLVCLAAFGIFFLPQGLDDVGARSLITSYDWHSHFLPKFVHGSEELLAGRLPVWNPYEYGGLPFLATAQPAVFYPPKLLLFGFLPTETAHWTFLFLHYAALVIGIVWFFRERKIVGAPALVGAAVWTFAYPIVGSSYHPTRVANLVWIPFIFVFVERIAKGDVRKSLPWLILVVVLQLTSGYPEFTIDLGLLLAVHGIASWALKDWKTPPWKTVPIFGAAFVFAALIAAVQLLPLAELGMEAKRVALVESHREQLGVEVAVADLVPSLMSLFPGLVIFLLPGLLRRRGWAPAAGLLTCEIMGNGGWLLLRELPGFSSIRFPWVWAFLVSFYVAWLAAVGCEVLVEKLESKKTSKAGAWLLASAAIAWAAYCGVHWYDLHLPALYDALHRALELNWLAPIPEPATGWAKLGRIIGTELGAALGIGGALALALYAMPPLRGKFPRWSLYVAVTTLTLAQGAGYPYGAETAPFSRPFDVGMVQRLHGNQEPVKGRAFATNDILYGYNITDRIPSLFGGEMSFVPWRYRRVIEDLEFLPFLDYINWEKLARARGFLDALDVRYFATVPLLAPRLAPHGIRPVRASGNEMLFENHDAMGPAWVNYAVRIIPSEEMARGYVLGPYFNPHHEVVLIEPLKREYPTRTSDPVTRPKRVRRTSATLVEFDVELPRPGIFVVSESAYPGWKASVDGEPVEWFNADYVLRAVELDRGSHTVRFEYRPWSIRWGLIISGVSLLGLVSMFVLARRRRWKAAEEDTSRTPQD